MEKKRDLSLDYLRAIGCLTMIFGHMQLFDQTHPVHSKIVLLISVGTLFFFTVSGIVASFQTTKYRFSRIVFYYSLLFLLGLSYGFLIHPGKLGFLALEIIGIIALGSIATAAIEYFFKPKNYLYLLIALAIFGIKFSRDFLFPHIEFYGFLFPPGYNPETKFLHYTCFAIFPWLYLFPLGVFMYRVKNIYNLLFFFICGVVLAILFISPYAVDIFNFNKKFDMSIGYFLLISGVSFFMFFLIRMISPYLPAKRNPLLTFGQNSLLFLFIHGIGMITAGVLFLYVFKYKNQYLAWLSAIIINMLLMEGFSRIPQISLFKYRAAWYILILCIILTPFIFHNKTALIITIEGIFGIIFALNYKLLAVVIKQKNTSTERLVSAQDQPV